MISAWWIPAYFFYHVALASVLDAKSVRTTHNVYQDGHWMGRRPYQKEYLVRSIMLAWFNYFCTGYAVYTYARIFDYGDYESSIPILIAKFLACVVLVDIWFYTTHRILHIPALFRRYHTIHHQWVDPISYAAYYCHPMENLIANIGSVLVPLYLVNASTLLLHLWVISAVTQSTISHAGPLEMLDGSTGISAHDIHHHYFNVEFGINLFMDRLLGTSYKSLIE